MILAQPTAAATTLDEAGAEAQNPSANLKAQLMAEFERWVDQMLLDEPAPRGVPEHLLSEASEPEATETAGKKIDLYTLFSALTSLSGEIGLQGRAFKQLSELLSPLAETPAMLGQLREAQLQSARGIQQILDGQAQKETVEFKQVVPVLIDLHDRLQRGLLTCDEGIASLQSRRRPGGMLQRLVSGPDSSQDAVTAVKAIRDAAAMMLARLQAAMQEWSVQRIGNRGDPFDPDRMTAIEVRETPGGESGRVLEVHRSGYALNGVVKSTAQVSVGKAK